MSIDITAVDRKEQREETNTDEDEGARTDGGQMSQAIEHGVGEAFGLLVERSPLGGGRG